METLGNRIKTVMEERGLNANSLAQAVGVSRPAIAKILEDQVRNPKYLFEIAQALDVSVGWLKTGEMPPSFSDDLETARLDLFDVAASCGSGHLNADYPELLHSLEIPKSALKELLGTDNLHGVKLMAPDGDSMEPTIPPKSITLIKTDVVDFESSGVYLFTFQGYTYIKRLARGKAGVIHVTSDNPIYGKSDFVIEPEEFDDLFIHGKFWKVLPLNFLDI